MVRIRKSFSHPKDRQGWNLKQCFGHLPMKTVSRTDSRFFTREISGFWISRSGYSSGDRRWIDFTNGLEIIDENFNYGAAGFLGSHLCDFLLEKGHEIVGMDNFITGSPENLAHFAGNTNFQFIKHDVSEYILFRVSWITSFILPLRPVQIPHLSSGTPTCQFKP